MTGNNLECSIVIRAYNEAAHIRRLLEGIQQQTIKPNQVILVDSGSSDDTVAIASQFAVQVIHIRPQEFSFGRSLNLGITQAKSEYIVIASAHIYPVYPDWLEKMLKPFEDSRIGLTYGKQRGAPDTHFSEHRVFERWFPDDPVFHQPHPFCNNANAAIRRDLWEKHPYNESISGLEDLEWANWMMEQGYQISYIPEAEIIHIHQESPRQVYNRYRREAMAFKRIFPNEQFNFWDFLQLYSSNSISDLKYAFRAGEIRLHWRSILWFRLVQFWGTYQGYRQSGQLNWQLRQTFYYPNHSQNESPFSSRKIEPIQYNDLQDPND